MPNNTFTMGVDILPAADDTYNLGNSSTKWRLNGYEVVAISDDDIDDIIEDVFPEASGTSS